MSICACSAAASGGAAACLARGLKSSCDSLERARRAEDEDEEDDTADTAADAKAGAMTRAIAEEEDAEAEEHEARATEASAERARMASIFKCVNCDLPSEPLARHAAPAPRRRPISLPSRIAQQQLRHR